MNICIYIYLSTLIIDFPFAALVPLSKSRPVVRVASCPKDSKINCKKQKEGGIESFGDGSIVFKDRPFLSSPIQ